jgi:hypothetical protein
VTTTSDFVYLSISLKQLLIKIPAGLGKAEFCFAAWSVLQVHGQLTFLLNHPKKSRSFRLALLARSVTRWEGGRWRRGGKREREKERERGERHKTWIVSDTRGGEVDMAVYNLCMTHMSIVNARIRVVFPDTGVGL